jgi:anthranilate synthase component 2
MRTRRLAVIDNYDSFTYNLVQLFLPLVEDIEVFRHDEVDVPRLQSVLPSHLLISPGPKDPASSGVSIPAISSFLGRIPILGVCLGMQCINELFGGRTLRAELPVHGKTSRIHHTGENMLRGLPSPFRAARYHSLCTEPGPKSPLQVDAWSEDGLIMALSLPRKRLFGLQFHPESFLTEHGPRMARTFLETQPLGEALYA